MLALADAQRSVATIAVFIATFLVTLSIGRLLKRRAGVPFGIFFQLFALTLSFYAAAWVYGFEMRWRNHLGAVLILLSTTILIAFINRYIWNAHFERRGIPVPKLLRDLVASLIFLIALMACSASVITRDAIERLARRLGRARHHSRLRRPESSQQRHRRSFAANSTIPTKSAIGSSWARPMAK